MPFRFPLEAVLHYRRSLEHQQELRLRTANQQVGRVRRLIELAEERIRQAHAAQARELAAGTTFAEVRFALAAEAFLEGQRQTLERELHRLETLRNQQQRIFQQARRDRETFESLRDRQKREYDRDQARREQRNLDDLFLLRRYSPQPDAQ
jgi:flagellar export protein FliJ